MNTYVLNVPTGREKYMQELLEKLVAEAAGPLAEMAPEAPEPNGTVTEDPAAGIGRIWIPRKRIHHRNSAEERARTGEVLTMRRELLFPSYLFVEAESFECIRSTLALLRGMDSYAKPLGAEDEEALRIVRPDELERIRRLTGENRARIESGRVRIVSGPMRGMDGLIVKLDRRKQNVMLRMDFFGREMELWIGLEFLEQETK